MAKPFRALFPVQAGGGAGSIQGVIKTGSAYISRITLQDFAFQNSGLIYAEYQTSRRCK
jgi:hypothetical protein